MLFSIHIEHMQVHRIEYLNYNSSKKKCKNYAHKRIQLNRCMLVYFKVIHLSKPYIPTHSDLLKISLNYESQVGNKHC
jgi:hypothetical protein